MNNQSTHDAKESGRYVINMICIFFLILFLNGSRYSPAGELLELFRVFGLIIFIVGLVYGLFRLGGVRISTLDVFFVNFPLFWWDDMPVAQLPYDAPKDKSGKDSSYVPNDFAPVKTIDWRQFCSFRYLRGAGILLIIVGLFSLAFTLDLAIIHRAMLAGIAAGFAFTGAEMLQRTGRTAWSPLAAILGFALMHICLNLLSQYFAIEQTASTMNDPHVWLIIKLIASILYLPLLERYSSHYHEHAYLFIASVAPITLAMVGTPITNGLAAAMFVVTIGIIGKWLSLSRKNEFILSLSMLLSFFVVLLLFLAPDSDLFLKQAPNLLEMLGLQPQSIMMMPSDKPIVWWGAALSLLLFIGYLGTLITLAVKNIRSLSYLPLILLHGLIVLWLFIARNNIDVLQDNYGVALLIVSAISFVGSLILEIDDLKDNFAQVLMNLCIILSSLGVFMQFSGEWSSVIFLSYACFILWLSLRTRFLRSLIYGFIILTVALLRFIFDLGDIFSSVSATIWLIIIGIIFVVLSFKYEEIIDAIFDAKNDLSKRIK